MCPVLGTKGGYVFEKVSFILFHLFHWDCCRPGSKTLTRIYEAGMSSSLNQPRADRTAEADGLLKLHQQCLGKQPMNNRLKSGMSFLPFPFFIDNYL